MKKILFFVLALLLLLPLAACNSNSKSSYDNGSSSSSSDALVYSTERSVQYSVEYYYKNSKVDAIKEEKKTIRDYILNVNGYILESSESETYSRIEYKVPTNKLNEVIEFIDERDGYDDKTTRTYDITNVYDALGQEIETLKTRKAQYEAMLEDTSLSLEDRIHINELVDEINNHLSAKTREYAENQDSVEYSTLTIRYNQYTNPSFGTVMLALLQFFGITAIILCPFAVVGLIVFLVLRKKKNKEVKA